MGRELYDLCRRYKYYWKKVEDVKHLNDKYHDLDLASAISNSYGQLMETEDDMLKQLFKDFDVMCSNIEVHQDITEPNWLYSRFGQHCLGRPRIVGSEAMIEMKNSNRFIRCLSDYMSDLRKEWRNK